MFRKLETTRCTESLTKEGNSTCLGLWRCFTSSRKLSRLLWLVRMRTATDTHTHSWSVYVCVFVLSRFCLQWLPSCVTSPMHSVTSWHVGVCRSCQSCSGLTTVEFCVHASSPCYTIWLLRRYSRRTLLLLDSKPSAVLLFKYKV